MELSASTGNRGSLVILEYQLSLQSNNSPKSPEAQSRALTM